MTGLRRAFAHEAQHLWAVQEIKAESLSYEQEFKGQGLFLSSPVVVLSLVNIECALTLQAGHAPETH